MYAFIIIVLNIVIFFISFFYFVDLFYSRFISLSSLIIFVETMVWLALCFFHFYIFFSNYSCLLSWIIIFISCCSDSVLDVCLKTRMFFFELRGYGFAQISLVHCCHCSGNLSLLLWNILVINVLKLLLK